MRPSAAGIARILLPVVAAGALLGAQLAVAPVARAADPATFGTPSAQARFGQQVRFEQPVTLNGRPRRTEVLVSAPGGLGPQVTEVQPDATDGPTTLAFTLLIADGHITPNTRLEARWRITGADGSVALGPSVSITYVDDRIDWNTRSDGLVRLHWYEGDDAFATRALKIGNDAVSRAAELLGVTETEPVDFFIYADRSRFYDALGPGTRENVGGEAHDDIRTLFALIGPDEIRDAWVGQVVPHELTHLVFDTATKNPYRSPPRWLNEGVAVYLSEGFAESWRSALRAAVAGGTVIPLSGLGFQFPTTREQFYLAYAESVSAVDYLIRAHGTDALVKLIRSYQEGLTDDEALGRAIGVDLAGFEAGWLRDIGAGAPRAYGPQTAPPGPTPAGWGGATPGSVPPASTGPSGAPAAIAAAALAAAGVALAGVLLARRRSRGTPAGTA